jgi:hypothetical protein
MNKIIFAESEKLKDEKLYMVSKEDGLKCMKMIYDNMKKGEEKIIMNGMVKIVKY